MTSNQKTVALCVSIFLLILFSVFIGLLRQENALLKSYGCYYPTFETKEESAKFLHWMKDQETFSASTVTELNDGQYTIKFCVQ